MAQRQYDIEVGQDKVALTEASGSSIGTSAVQITLDDANVTSKAEALRLIDVVKQRIVEDTWPPA